MIDVLDREVDAEIRYTIMEECGRRCIGANTLQKRSPPTEGCD
jgi:hypothetical protein